MQGMQNNMAGGGEMVSPTQLSSIFLLKGRTWKKTKIYLIIGLVEIPYLAVGMTNLAKHESAKMICEKSANFIKVVLYNQKMKAPTWSILSLITSIYA